MLCIKQSSEDEKSHQIGLMQDIYTTAETVLIWLGGNNSVKSSNGLDKRIIAVEILLCFSKGIKGKRSKVSRLCVYFKIYYG